MAESSNLVSQEKKDEPASGTSADAPTPSDHKEAPAGSQAVRFSTVNQEIEPEESFTTTEETTSAQPLSSETDAELRELSKSIHGINLQSRRMSNFTFEPVSLPASRVPSNESSPHEASSHETSRHPTHSSSDRPSPHPSPRAAALHTPPLTPAGSQSLTGEPGGTVKGAPLEKVEAEEDPSVEAPQISPPRTGQSTHTTYTSSRPGSSGQLSTRPTTVSSDSTESVPKHSGAFAIGPSAEDSSVPASREPSPNRGHYSRPFTPAGEPNDPYAASKRPPQPKNLDNIEPRFVFSSRAQRHRTSPSSSSSTVVPRSTRSSTDLKTNDKKASFLGKKDHHLSHLHDESAATLHKTHGSMSELKRFLKIGSSHKSKRAVSPAPSNKSGTKTPPHHKTPQQLPFGDDHGLSSKYGKFGKVLGAGAGGSVRLMKRTSDGTMFAVKEFRARHTYETEREYAKKVTAEFCIGSTLHHGNIIETLDIVHEKGKWYEVMEYAPFDLFAIVMTGKMSREEITCSFLQILSGVTYLHSMGLAHRDLKLDNVVVNDQGIMKIIDFGSASMFKYPFENEIVLASGIVGSDPYLAPEVYDERKYDPQPADIWSLAIIFCCMSLRRFPWKMPRMTDNSYKLFASPPSPPSETRKPSETAHTTTDGQSSAAAKSGEAEGDKSAHGEKTGSSDSQTTTTTTTTSEPAKKPEVIKGPWRLLRLLPRESRHIIGRMLEIDPKKRATMAEVLDDPWVRNTDICRQEAPGAVYHAPGHTHTLEPPSPPPTANNKS